MRKGFLIALLTVVAVFSVQNAALVPVVVFLWKFEAPLTLVIAAAMLIGMLAGVLIVYRPRKQMREKDQDPLVANGGGGS